MGSWNSLQNGKDTPKIITLGRKLKPTTDPEWVVNILLTFVSFFVFKPLTRDHLIELEAEELAKRYHCEIKGKVNSDKGRKKHAKRLQQLWKSLHCFSIHYHSQRKCLLHWLRKLLSLLIVHKT